jgi:hypothetical protein
MNELPPVEEMLERICRVETRAFEAAERERLAAEQPAPVAGRVVAIASGATRFEYRVNRIPTTWGHGFQLVKVCGDEASYCVLIGRPGEVDRCDCAAATFQPYKPCKHVIACRSLVQRDLDRW